MCVCVAGQQPVVPVELYYAADEPDSKSPQVAPLPQVAPSQCLCRRQRRSQGLLSLVPNLRFTS